MEMTYETREAAREYVRRHTSADVLGETETREAYAGWFQTPAPREWGVEAVWAALCGAVLL